MHFTYFQPDAANLNQGDILRRTPSVEEMLRAVHPHYYEKPDYRFLIVLTQSCDLVRRDGRPCKSRYITLAAVRPMILAVQREVEALFYNDVEAKVRVLDHQRRDKLADFVERLLNNNEESHFFLQREPDAGLDDDYCAFLRLSISVKSELHYHTLLAAKVLQLTDSFQHKLGHLVGTMYSRIGTEDWVPRHAARETFRARVLRVADKAAEELEVPFVERDLLKKIVDRAKALLPDELTNQRVKDLIEEVTLSREDRVAAAVKDAVEVLSALNADSLLVDQFRGRLTQRQSFRSRIK